MPKATKGARFAFAGLVVIRDFSRHLVAVYNYGGHPEELETTDRFSSSTKHLNIRNCPAFRADRHPRFRRHCHAALGSLKNSSAANEAMSKAIQVKALPG